MLHPATLLLAFIAAQPAQVLDKQKLLEAQTFWDNRDWDWYKANIPFLETPDPDIDTTYYYRWELLTKHLTYGSPDSGYSFTEFIDRPFWSGAYGAISCPAGHQLYEARWLKDGRIARDYSRYWLRTPGAQPRNYSTWLADAIWAVHRVQPDRSFVQDLLPDLIRNFEAWEERHFVPEVGLFWQTGHDDGMEYNINSRQTQDIVRGAPGFRPTLNSYLWADALAIARIARLGGDETKAKAYEAKADALKDKVQELLWDPGRTFFLHKFQRDEERDGHAVKALTFTHQTGRFAGSPYGRELIGYVPWQFSLPDPGYEDAWRFLMDRERFLADFGPTTVERRDPMFHLEKTCCWWSGQSWPYATAQTLTALANVLNNYTQGFVTRADYLKLLRTFARTHRKDGRPYLAEAAHPDTGSWEGHDSYNHSEHYFHSSFCDLVITGLAGLRPRDDDWIEVNPLFPAEWDYFALDDVYYRGRYVSILWDRTGERYQQGKGFHILVDGEKIGTSTLLAKLTAAMPRPTRYGPSRERLINHAVNNEGTYFPRVSVSHVSGTSSTAALNDGNSWYHASPPNRWTCEGSPSSEDWCAVDFGMPRPVEEVRLYFLDDGQGVTPPVRVALERWDGASWIEIPGQTRIPAQVAGRRANRIKFPAIETPKLRAVLTHRDGARSGLTELEAWGRGKLPYQPAPPPAGNLALNAKGEGLPRASASFTSRFDRVSFANDGRVAFRPTPNNRWTAYESPNESDWLELDFGKPQRVARVELHLYDDRGGVQAPASYTVELWDGAAWTEARDQRREPETPRGGMVNTVRFAPAEAAKLRVVFRHRGKARSGVTEIEVWAE
jgi:hypothetical protein